MRPFFNAGVAIVLFLPPALPAQTLREFVFGQTAENRGLTEVSIPDSVEVYVDGNVRNALSSNSQTTVAAGSIGFNVRKQTVVLDVSINALGTSGPLTEGHAASVLAPGAGGSLSAGFGEVRFRPGTRAGFRGYVSVSTARWTDTVTDVTNGVLTGGVGAGAFVNLFGGSVNVPLPPPDEPSEGAAAGKAAEEAADANADQGRVTASPKRTRVAGVLDIGLVWRTLGGDITRDANRAQLVNILGSDTRDRIGLEIGLALQLNDLRAGLTYYLFSGDVPGLSNGQLVAGFAVSTPLLGGRIAAHEDAAEAKKAKEEQG